MKFRADGRSNVLRRIGDTFLITSVGLLFLAFAMPGQAGLMAITCAAAAVIIGTGLTAVGHWIAQISFPLSRVALAGLLLAIFAIVGPVVAAAGP